ncbi:MULTISPECIES: Crp/Fnr family transcriptional regulator [Sphaerochaeta]|jgi:CRP-like cAMP-binding protein|uniref:Crp/Fnr family transcriptional regulator n=1 Tax=Sphaerochaeta associata TaxID=1129264 RepID=A0ABY4D7V3_9SPIR|nr:MULTISPECIES: Crp/Fnr family transcriptional regulator [Sphaerochaeta]NLA98772.1 Crp/Fnr family transcriptional regulator [Spirochaetales bacterium]MDD3423272.1 Crp/Fnr family transcriptional regulator [Sphaerochaeta sp.]MDD3455706.1 Crp/Fnr family transcriptional regulator [Sphaerochaeta sp.]MEA5107985.1 Crp/Fnr family transcriptional regulator [Sphaerochaeta associata]UOM50231.1 Crp/Fnr family transcriptional regulator [Sphaerochaeta associata]
MAMMHCSACSDGTSPCLHNVPIFQHLDPSEIGRVQRLILQRELEADEVLFREGDASENLYIVRSGSLKLVRYSVDGKELLLDTLFPGDFYGSDGLFAPGTVQESAIAEQGSGICMIQGEKLKQLMLADPSISLKVMTYLNTKLEQYRQQLEMLCTKDVTKRICMYLHQRAVRSANLELFLSQEDIGNATHLTKETVNRKLAVLQEQQIIRITGKKKITIADLAKLKELAF